MLLGRLFHIADAMSAFETLRWRQEFIQGASRCDSSDTMLLCIAFVGVTPNNISKNGTRYCARLALEVILALGGAKASQWVTSDSTSSLVSLFHACLLRHASFTHNLMRPVTTLGKGPESREDLLQRWSLGSVPEQTSNREGLGNAINKLRLFSCNREQPFPAPGVD